MKSVASLAMVFVFCASSASWSQDCCCDRCGCEAQCEKVCRCIPDVKKVPKVTYSCECEDFCVPGPSDRCLADNCDCDCDSHCWWKKKWIYTPNCAQVRTRKKLVKHETTEEKCTYKWVVEKQCCGCAAKSNEEGEQAIAAGAPPKPRIDVATVSYQKPLASAPQPQAEAEQTAADEAQEKGFAASFRRMMAPIFGKK